MNEHFDVQTDEAYRPTAILPLPHNLMRNTMRDFVPGNKIRVLRTENTLALFFGFIPANFLDSYRKPLDPIIETLQIP